MHPTATTNDHPAASPTSELTIPFRGTPRVFTTELVLARPCEEIFPFFADAQNLERITPPFLRFEVLTPGEIEMRPGALIDYRLKVRGIPLRWRTEITVWEPPHRFVDVQRKGPYRLWHHEHTFRDTGDGRTLCRDIVHYAHAGGPIVDRLLVRPDIERIFRYRGEQLAAVFGSAE